MTNKGWEEEFDELTKTMDGQYRPKLRLLFIRTREEAVDEWIRKNQPITDFHCSEHKNPIPTCFACSNKAREEAFQEAYKLYDELILAVSNKHPNETRHQTALRYIKQAEQGSSEASADKALKDYKKTFDDLAEHDRGSKPDEMSKEGLYGAAWRHGGKEGVEYLKKYLP